MGCKDGTILLKVNTIGPRYNSHPHCWYHDCEQEYRDPAGNLVAFKAKPETVEGERYPKPLKWQLFGTRCAVAEQASSLTRDGTALYLWGEILHDVRQDKIVYVETGSDTSQPPRLTVEREASFVGPGGELVAVVSRQMPPKLSVAARVDPIVAIAVAHANYGWGQFCMTLF